MGGDAIAPATENAGRGRCFGRPATAPPTADGVNSDRSGAARRSSTENRPELRRLAGADDVKGHGLARLELNEDVFDRVPRVDRLIIDPDQNVAFLESCACGRAAGCDGRSSDVTRVLPAREQDAVIHAEMLPLHHAGVDDLVTDPEVRPRH